MTTSNWPKADAAREKRIDEVRSLSLAQLRRNYIQRTGDARPPRKWKCGDYIEIEALAAWNAAAAQELEASS